MNCIKSMSNFKKVIAEERGGGRALSILIICFDTCAGSAKTLGPEIQDSNVI